MQSSNISRKCEVCGTANAIENHFCKKCGSRLLMSEFCPRCGNKLEVDSVFCPDCGFELGPVSTIHSSSAASKEIEATKIVEMLETNGIDSVTADILSMYRKQYPGLQQDHIPREFFELFWAREYKITHKMTDDCEKLARIQAEVENRAQLEAMNQERMREQGAMAKERIHDRHEEFEQKDFEELTEEAWSWLEDLLQKHSLHLELSSTHDLERILRDFWQGYNLNPLSGLHQLKKEKVNQAVLAKWQKAAFAEYYKMLSEKEKENARALKDLLDRPSEEIAEKIISVFEREEYWPALLDRSPQGRRVKFWEDLDKSKIFPWHFPVQSVETPWAPYHKWWDTKNLVMAKLPEAERRVYDRILAKVVELAKVRGKEATTEADVCEILATLGLMYTPERFKKELRRDVNRTLSS